MSENTKIWDALSKTNPAHTKPFKRAGGFSGTAVKPIYLSHKMTEQFGACGIGWGMTEPKFDVVNCGEDIAVYCTVGLWHVAKDNLIYGVGGDFCLKQQTNRKFADDEAFKKAYTDALGNAMKQLGMSADVHMGQHDDDKYVRELKHEFATESAPSKPKAEEPNAEDAPFKALARTIKDAIDAAGDVNAVNLVMEDYRDDLIGLKKHSTPAEKFLQDRAAKRRAMLADAPIDDSIPFS